MAVAGSRPLPPQASAVVAAVCRVRALAGGGLLRRRRCRRPWLRRGSVWARRPCRAGFVFVRLRPWRGWRWPGFGGSGRAGLRGRRPFGVVAVWRLRRRSAARAPRRAHSRGGGAGLGGVRGVLRLAQLARLAADRTLRGRAWLARIRVPGRVSVDRGVWTAGSGLEFMLLLFGSPADVLIRQRNR